MQSLIPDLNTPLDEVAAFSLWFRLGPEALADVLPFCTKRRQSGKDVFYTLAGSDIRRFIAERRKLNSSFSEESVILEMLAAPRHLCMSGDVNVIAESGVLVELWHEQGNSTEGMLKVTGGNRHLTQ